MPRYFVHDPSKRTLLEDWRLARSLRKLLILWMARLSGQPIGSGQPFAYSVPFTDFQVEPEGVPAVVAPAIAAAVDDAVRAGFVSPLYQVIPSPSSFSTSVTLQHPRGRTVARIIHVRLETARPPVERTTMTLMSRLEDGRLLSTSNARKTFNSKPGTIGTSCPGARCRELLERHERRLAGLPAGAQPTLVADDEAARAFIDRMESESMSFNVQRGLFKEVDPETVAAASSAPAASDATLDPMEAAVLAQIAKQEAGKTSWQSFILVAALSLALFIGLGGLRWNWRFAAILAGVVVFHESGHYVAMRFFGYRNLRMFFIPLAGAAVVGRNYNVAGWKKVLVALAGPVPGIAVALGLVLAGATTDSALLHEIALVSFILNGINLLPFIPLDGGWVMHAILFCRHPILEAVARVLAVVALALGAIRFHAPFTGALAFLVAMGLPASFRLARLAARLRAEGVTATSPDAKSIPRDASLAILRRLRETMPEPHHAARFAPQVVGVFEKINARPPGLLASVVLLAVYIGTIGAAASGAGAHYFRRSSPPVRRVMHGMPAPRHGFTSAETFAGPAGAPMGAAPVDLVLRTFADELSAGGTASELRHELHAGETLTRFGETLFVATPERDAGTERWKALLETPARGSAALPPQAVTMDGFRLTCRAPDEKTASWLADDIELVAAYRHLHVRPPWVSPPAGRSDADQVAEDRARRTWHRFLEIARELRADPHVASLQAAYDADQLDDRVSDAVSERASDELDAAYYETTDRLVRRELEGDTAGALDPELLTLLVRQARSPVRIDLGDPQKEGPKVRELDERIADGRRAIAARMGVQVPIPGEPTSPAGDGFFATHQGRYLDIRALSSPRPDLGLPLLACYLQEHGGADIRYEWLEERPRPRSQH